MRWSFKKGDFVTFNTVQSDLVHLNGKVFEVMDRLTEKEADLNETGPMYRLAEDGYVLGQPRLTIDAYEDELTLTDKSKFRNMVDTYRALGYRMVVFDTPYVDGYGTSSWVYAFNTHGVNADELPIEAFANEDWLKALHEYASYHGPVSEVEHMDVTDDPDEVIIGYDFTAEFPVQELVSDWQ